jgi:hypothetical protein
MAGINTTIITDATKTQSSAGVVDTTFRNNEVLGRFGLVEDTGGTTYNVKMGYGTNSSVGVFSEGDAFGIPGSQSYVTASWPFTYYKGLMSYTGHAVDQLKNGNPQAAFFDQTGMELTKLSADITDKASTDALGTGLTSPVGIQGIADSTGTIAGLSRATYAWFAAYENAYSTTVALADIDAADRFSRDADYASDYNEIWCAPKQIQKLRGVVGLAGIANNSIKIDSGGTIKLSSNGDGLMYGNKPFVPIRDLTDSILIGCQTNELFLSWRRQMKVDHMAKVDDSEKFAVTMALCIGARNPKHFWKATGYSA